MMPVVSRRSGKKLEKCHPLFLVMSTVTFWYLHICVKYEVVSNSINKRRSLSLHMHLPFFYSDDLLCLKSGSVWR